MLSVHADSVIYSSDARSMCDLPCPVELIQRVWDVQGHPAVTPTMIGRTYLERGAPVVVLTRWAGKGPRNVLIRRDDGSMAVRPFRGLRRAQISGSTVDKVRSET